MKVRFFSNYDSSENLLKRFLDNYPVNDNTLQFTCGYDYDYAVVFNKTNERLSTKCIVIAIVQEPSWSPVWRGNTFESWADYVIVHDKTLFNINEKLLTKVFEEPSYMWFHDHEKYSFYNNIEHVKKRKKLSFIVSGLNMDIPNTNYTKRIDLLNKILASDLDIEIYGKGLQIDDKRFKGEVKNKYYGLVEFEYSIAIENSGEYNYVTEKLYDCILCNTKPIYVGAPNISEIIDSEAYSLIDLNSPTIIEDIKGIITQPVNSDSLLKEKINYLYTRNLYTKLKQICLQ